MRADPTLYALVLENNRMLKELTARFVPKPQSDSSAASEEAYGKFMSGYREVARQNAEGAPVVCAPTEHRPLTESDMHHVLKTGEAPEDGLPIRIHAANIPAAKRALAQMEREDRLRRGLPEYERPPLGNPPPYIVEERVTNALGPLLWPDWDAMPPKPSLGAVLNAASVRLKTHGTVAAEAREEAERDAAARINEALGYQVQKPNLDESLAVLRNKAQFGVLAGSAASLVQASIRESTERLVRAQVTDRLCAIISPDRRAPVDMAWVEAKVRELVKFQQEHATPDAVRDAALEEAATKLGCKGHCAAGTICAGCAAAKMVRALKSRPTKFSGMDYGPKPDVTRVSVLEVRDVPPEPCEVPGCVEPRGHVLRLFHPDANGNPIVIPIEGKLRAPEPLHDFGWALQQMREGKKVRRKAFIPSANFRIEGTYVMNHTSSEQRLVPWEDCLATDWEVAG